MKTAIIGSRGLKIKIEQYIPKGVSLIVSGGATGIDELAELYAVKHNIPILIFRPDYKSYGKSAPLIRNKLIAEAAEVVVAFWDGQSKGTKFAIDYAIKIGKRTVVYVFQHQSYSNITPFSLK